jgi:hypothetical protein
MSSLRGSAQHLQTVNEGCRALVKVAKSSRDDAQKRCQYPGICRTLGSLIEQWS